MEPPPAACGSIRDNVTKAPLLPRAPQDTQASKHSDGTAAHAGTQHTATEHAHTTQHNRTHNLRNQDAESARCARCNSRCRTSK